jgi:hypothetical protein
MATRLGYAAFSAAGSIAVLTGQHRGLYRALDAAGTPELAAAAITGLAGLAWYELAYVVGGGLRSARLFLALPYLGALAGLAAAAGALARGRFLRGAAAAHLGTALGVGGLALAVLVWRAARGFADPWRLVATAGFLASHAAWAVRLAPVLSRAPAGSRTPPAGG